MLITYLPWAWGCDAPLRVSPHAPQRHGGLGHRYLRSHHRSFEGPRHGHEPIAVGVRQRLHASCSEVPGRQANESGVQ
eukprot:15448513-Alexandrium_andersonii.AAC.1